MAKVRQKRDLPALTSYEERQISGTTALAATPQSARPVIELVAPPQPGMKARQLFQEAKRASLEHLSALQTAIELVQALLDDVVGGGDVYAPGLGEFAGRLKEDLFWKSKTLEALAQKQRLRVYGLSR